MAKKAKKVAKGKRLTRGKGWEIKDSAGKVRFFKATLLGTHNIGTSRIAVFSVPKRKRRS